MRCDDAQLGHVAPSRRRAPGVPRGRRSTTTSAACADVPGVRAGVVHDLRADAAGRGRRPRSRRRPPLRSRRRPAFLRRACRRPTPAPAMAGGPGRRPATPAPAPLVVRGGGRGRRRPGRRGDVRRARPEPGPPRRPTCPTRVVAGADRRRPASTPASARRGDTGAGGARRVRRAPGLPGPRVAGPARAGDHRGRAAAERAEGALIVDGDGWWHDDRPGGCSPAAGPGDAAPTAPARWVARRSPGREPFSDGRPVPLELIVPVDSFTLAARPGRASAPGRSPGTRGRRRRRDGGAGRPVPRRPVRRRRPASGAPRPTRWSCGSTPSTSCRSAVTVRAADDAGARAWAAAQARPTPRATVVAALRRSLRWRINEPGGRRRFAIPPDAPVDDHRRRVPAGHAGEAPDVPGPGARPPAGFRSYRSGHVTGARRPRRSACGRGPTGAPG